MLNINVITLFPELIDQALKFGVIGEARESGRFQLQLINPRDFSQDRHRSVDDRPFGGSDGMVMSIAPLQKALESLSPRAGKVVLLSPQGERWSDTTARSWAKQTNDLTLICGRYAGVDERLIQTKVDAEISVGDYVLSGGEFAALILIDSVVRLLPGTLGNPLSKDAESFREGLLECPQFTRPAAHEFGEVPSFLLSGNHREIEELKQAIALLRTERRRPDLLRVEHRQRLPWARQRVAHLSQNEQRLLGIEV